MGRFPDERREEINDRLWDHTTMRIYCDVSQNLKTKLMAIAALFVFDGETEVYTKVLGTRVDNNIVGEIEAVKFAIRQIPVFKSRPSVVGEPYEVVVYSDYNLIAQYVQDVEGVRIVHIGDDKKHNPFYTAAHNAARKAIFLRPKSGRLHW